MKRFAITLFLLLFAVPSMAPAITTTTVSVVPTVEYADSAYDAGSVRVISDNALTGLAATVLQVPLFVPTVGLVAAKSGTKDLTSLYQKVGAEGEHLKFGITKNPATRYTQEELAGGKLRIVGQGSREEMLQLERNIHETLPIGPEEAQKFYIQKQVQKELKPPPYGGD